MLIIASGDRFKLSLITLFFTGDSLIKKPPICHFCAEPGHKASYCPQMPQDQKDLIHRQEDNKHKMQRNAQHNTFDGTEEIQKQHKAPPRPLEEITCFKCGTKGHYANKCPKGFLAFLSQSNKNRLE